MANRYAAEVLVAGSAPHTIRKLTGDRMDTTEARAKAGWYPAKGMPGMLRYWNGEAWVKEVPPRKAPVGLKKPEPPASLIFVGFLAALVGGGIVALGLGDDSLLLVFIGWAVVSFSGVVLGVGTIAAGVRLGMRWADFERWQRDPS